VTGVVLGAAVLGAVVGALVDRAAARFPWPRPATVGGVLGGRGGVAPPGVLPVATAALFAVVALRFGTTAQLAAWLWFAAAGVLLAVIDLRERLLPDRALVPAVAGSAVLLAVAAATGHAWLDLGRAVLGAVVLFTALLVLALAAPGQLGMGDVKLGVLLGLHLGWLGWPALLLGALAGFVLQSVLSIGLLATRRIGLKGHLPFGPAMLAGAAVVVGLPGLLAGGLSAL
jgi:leader peptidase (prepilin peptidase)/N-methyltransferase